MVIILSIVLTAYGTGFVFTLWSLWHHAPLTWESCLNAACWPLGLPVSILDELKRRADQKGPPF